MGILKWIGLEELDPFFKGEFGSTIGDSLSAVYGARHIHTIGERGAFTISPKSLLSLRGMTAVYPALSAMFLGESGDSRCVIGEDAMSVYKGPVSRVIRARQMERIFMPVFGDPEQDLREVTLADESVMNIDPADRALEATIMSMLRLTAAITVLFELSIHFAYPNFGKEEGEALVPEIIEKLGSAIVSRLLAVIHCMETMGGESEDAKNRLKEAVAAGESFPVTRMYFAGWGDEATALWGSVKTTLREKWTSTRAWLASEEALILYATLAVLLVASTALAVGLTDNSRNNN
jgi:hypothetical protein